MRDKRKKSHLNVHHNMHEIPNIHVAPSINMEFLKCPWLSVPHDWTEQKRKNKW